MNKRSTILALIASIVATTAHALVFEGDPSTIVVKRTSSTNEVIVEVNGEEVFANAREAAKHCYVLFEKSEHTARPISNSVNITFHGEFASSTVETFCRTFVRCRVYPLVVILARNGTTSHYDYSPGFLEK